MAWTDNATGETAYELQYGTASTFTTFTSVALSANATGRAVAGLTANTQYYFRVRASNVAGNSAFGNVATATTPSVGTAPSAPSTLAVTAAATTSSTVTLTWLDNASNETAQSLEYSTSSSFASPTAIPLASNVTSRTVSGLTRSTTYYFRVRASNAAGNSAYSNSATTTTLAAASAPAVPTGLTVTATSSSTLAVSWTDNATTEDDYALDYGTSGTFATFNTNVYASNARTGAVVGLAASTTYYVRVRARNGAGVGTSATVSATTLAASATRPAAPTGLYATTSADAPTSVVLNWTNPATNETNVLVQRRVNGVWIYVATLGPDSTTYTVANLTQGQDEAFRIINVNGAGESDSSNVAGGTPGQGGSGGGGGGGGGGGSGGGASSSGPDATTPGWYSVTLGAIIIDPNQGLTNVDDNLTTTYAEYFSAYSVQAALLNGISGNVVVRANPGSGFNDDQDKTFTWGQSAFKLPALTYNSSTRAFEGTVGLEDLYGWNGSDEDYDDDRWSVSVKRLAPNAFDLTVSDPANPANTVTNAGDFYVEEGSTGSATINLDGLLTENTDENRQHTLWRIDEPYAFQSQGDFSQFENGNDVELTVYDNNRLWTVKAGFDSNGNGNLDVAEITRTTEINLVKMTGITVRDAAFANVAITNDTAIARDLYIGEKTLAADGSVAAIEIDADTDPNALPLAGRAMTVFRVTGDATIPTDATGTLDDEPTVKLKPNAAGNRTFVVQVGFDNNKNGMLDEGEADRTVNVHVVKVDTLTATEVPSNPENKVVASAPPAESIPNLLVFERADGMAEVKIKYTGQPQDQPSSEKTFWKVEGTGVIGPAATDDFGALAEPTLTLTPPANRTATDGIYTVSIGFDDNDNGVLDASEIERQVKVYVLKVVTTKWGVAASTPLDTNPHLNGGRRIFTDKTSPTDTVAHDKVYVEAQVWPVPPVFVDVNFQSYDVDDPNAWVAGQALADQIDKNDSAGAKGLDNRGSTPGQRGTFPAHGITYRAAEATDFRGIATIQFQTTMQPGDNFRVAASMAGAELYAINDDTVPPNNAQMTPGIYAGALTDMLTVWRNLWIERDSMTGVVAHSENVTISTINPNSPQPNTGGGSNDVIVLSGQIAGKADIFEGGTLTIPSLGKTVRVYLNSDNLIQPDTVNVPANSFTAAEITSLQVGNVPAILTDDDLVPVSGTHALPSGGSLLGDAFGMAYIKPNYIDPGSTLNTRGTVPFREFADDDFGIGRASRDIDSENSFWATQIVGVHQNTAAYDGDPDADPAPATGIGVPTPGFDEKFDWGVSAKGAGAANNVSLIFMETIRDVGPNSGMPQAAVVVHEIAHTAGSEIVHKGTGLLREKEFGSETAFDNSTLWELRGVIQW